MGLFSKKFELTEIEQQYESIIVKLLLLEKTKKEVKITLLDSTYILSNEDKHLKVKIDSTGITLQNSTFATKERLRDKVVEHLRHLILEKINQDTDRTLLEMGEKEKNLLENINNLLNKDE